MTTFDIEIFLRTKLIGALVGYLVGLEYGISQEIATAAGVIAGGLYDYVAYKLKSYFRFRAA